MYVAPGLYAEGPTDYHFLLPLFDQILPEIAASALGVEPQLAPAVGIDAPGQINRRDERIAAAIDANWERCTLFILHTDGGGDPERSIRERIEPGIARARQSHEEAAVAICAPVREVEAWMLADAEAFRSIFEAGGTPELPPAPEALEDPKRALREVMASMARRVPWKPPDFFALLGGTIRIDALRKLPAFRDFEASVASALSQLAGGASGAAYIAQR